MLKRIAKSSGRATGATFAIVASKYNGRYVDAMLKAAQRELKQAGAKVRVVRVPGAFEIPAVAAALAAESTGSDSRLTPHASRPAAIICLGVIFQGQTSHAQHIGWGITHALAGIQVQHKLPVIHGVFVFEKEEHAKVRCLGRTHNRGTEAAHTALEMAKVMRGLGKAI
jgi:6,7-dimethyl-8-ribityllumazine synthase